MTSTTSKTLTIDINDIGLWAGIIGSPDAVINAIRDGTALPLAPRAAVNPAMAKATYKVNTGVGTVNDGALYSKKIGAVGGVNVVVKTICEGLTANGVVKAFGRSDWLTGRLTASEIATCQMLCFVADREECNWIESSVAKPNFVKYGKLSNDYRLIECIIDKVLYIVHCALYRKRYDLEVCDWISNFAAGWIVNNPYPKWSVFYNPIRHEYTCLCGVNSKKQLDKAHTQDCNPKFAN